MAKRQRNVAFDHDAYGPSHGERWTPQETDRVRKAVQDVLAGKRSIYDAVDILARGKLSHRTWEAIRSKFKRERRSMNAK